MKGRVAVGYWLVLALVHWGAVEAALPDFSQPAAVLATGQGQALISYSQAVGPVPGEMPTPELWFGFGFGSNEPLDWAGFFDSGTVTLQAAGNGATAILLTADRNGLLVAPVSPGALTLEPGAFQLEGIGFPEVGAPFSMEEAWLVRFSLPVELLEAPLTLYLDLFDNQNEHSSLAWISHPAVVPEPGTWGLFLFLSGVVLFFIRKVRHENPID
jgi:hypothetical protein